MDVDSPLRIKAVKSIFSSLSLAMILTLVRELEHVVYVKKVCSFKYSARSCTNRMDSLNPSYESSRSIGNANQNRCKAASHCKVLCNKGNESSWYFEISVILHLWSDGEGTVKSRLMANHSAPLSPGTETLETMQITVLAVRSSRVPAADPGVGQPSPPPLLWRQWDGLTVVHTHQKRPTLWIRIQSPFRSP